MARRRKPREGRGRLSSIDLLPDAAEEDIVWALEQLRERKLPQNLILEEFNERLLDKGIEPISKSAWGRYAVRKAIQFRRLDEIQRMSAELVSKMDPDEPDQVTVAVAEMLKLAVFQALEKDDASTKGIMELSRALSSAVSAQKASAEYRQKLEAEVRARVKEASDKLAKDAKKHGITPETLSAINRALGVG